MTTNKFDVEREINSSLYDHHNPKEHYSIDYAKRGYYNLLKYDEFGFYHTILRNVPLKNIIEMYDLVI